MPLSTQVYDIPVNGHLGSDVDFNLLHTENCSYIYLTEIRRRKSLVFHTAPAKEKKTSTVLSLDFVIIALLQSRDNLNPLTCILNLKKEGISYLRVL